MKHRNLGTVEEVKKAPLRVGKLLTEAWENYSQKFV